MANGDNNYSRMSDDERRKLASEILENYKNAILEIEYRVRVKHDIHPSEYYRLLALAKSEAVCRVANFK